MSDANLRHPVIEDEEYVAAFLDREFGQFGTIVQQLDGVVSAALQEFPISRGKDGLNGFESWNDEVAGRFADLRTRITGQTKAIDAAHTTAKAPVLSLGRRIDARKNKLTGDLDKMGAALKASLNLYLGEQEQRRRAAEAKALAEARARAAEAEEALRKNAADVAAMDRVGEAEEDAAIAAANLRAKAADLTRVHGDLGGVASLRTRWVFDQESSDLMTLVRAVADGKAPLAYLAFNTARIGIAVRTEKVRSIPGCIIKEEKSV